MNSPATFNLTPQSLDEALKLSEIMASSDIVPKDFKGKPGNVLVAVQMGAEVGLAPMQAIQNIAVINGRPSLWGDAIKAIILNSPLCEVFEEGFDDSASTAWVKVKRKGHAERIVTFSYEDATKAGLLTKTGPWTQYPKRMCSMRARAFAARDEFADVLKGLSVAEEAQDIPAEKEINPSKEIETKVITETGEVFWPQENFDKQFPRWEQAIQSGIKTPDEIIAMASSKGSLSSDQIKQISSIQGAA